MGVSIAIRPFLYCFGAKRCHLTPLFSRIFRIFADMKTIAAFLLALSLLCHVYAVACTSAIVGGHLTPDGRRCFGNTVTQVPSIILWRVSPLILPAKLTLWRYSMPVTLFCVRRG